MTRSAWVKAASLVAVAAAAWWGFQACGLNVLALTPERIRAFVASFGVWGPVAHLALFGQPFIPVPASVVVIAAGLAFGPWWGAAVSMVGAALRAALQYALARRMGRRVVNRLLHGRMAAIDQLIARHAFRSVLIIRLVPSFPFDIQNLSLGCSGVPFVPYLMATIVGMLPGIAGFAYFGHALTTPRSLWITLAIFALISGLAWVYSGKLMAKAPHALR